jgi:pimeloyl-ACP methyl ester carboxylesterase
MTTLIDLAIRPFEVHVPDGDLADLQRRIAATRWPGKETVADRSQGVQSSAIQDLVTYWASEYDWRACEAKLNALPQFTTEVDGLGIHFIHVRSRRQDALPLIITHGWPGSVLEMLGAVGPLTDPAAHGGRAEDAFHLVIPSLPGYGFSGQPESAGWDPGRVARAWTELMSRLGYTRYVAQGGDIGAAVTDTMAIQAPAGLAGIHLGKRQERRRRGRTSAARGLTPGRLHRVPRRDLPGPAAGPRRSTPTSSTSTKPTGAGTSPPGRNRTCSRRTPGRIPAPSLASRRQTAR